MSPKKMIVLSFAAAAAKLCEVFVKLTSGASGIGRAA